MLTNVNFDICHFLPGTFCFFKKSNIPEEKNKKEFVKGGSTEILYIGKNIKKTKIVNNGKNITKHLISMMDQQKS